MASVLVVDDEPDIRYLVQMALEADGHQVMTAANGIDALAAVEVEVPDVMLLDVMMPDLDGWSVLEQLKAHFDERIASVPVIMFTSLGTHLDQARGGIGGAVRYLVKPVDIDDLLGNVREVLNGPPESEQRRRAQTEALAVVARIEKGGDTLAAPIDPGPRLSRLERLRRPGSHDDGDEPIVAHGLTETQRAVLRTVLDADSVSNAAATLGVSRANVYASLRRTARSVGVGSVPDLLALLRSGSLVIADDE